MENEPDEYYDDIIQVPSSEFIRSLYVGIAIKTRTVQKDISNYIDSWRPLATPEFYYELDKIQWEIDQWILCDVEEDDDDEPDR